MPESTIPFSHLSILSAENEVVTSELGGVDYTLTRFQNSDNSAFAYGFAQSTPITPLYQVEAVTNTSGQRTMGSMVIPFDSLSLADKVRVVVELELSEPLDGTELTISFTDFRTQDRHRVKSNFGTKLTCRIEFDMVATGTGEVRFDSVGRGFDPDTYQNPSKHFNINTLGELELVVYTNFANSNGSVTATINEMSCVVGAAQLNKNGYFFGTRDIIDGVPFAEDDVFNQQISANVVTRAPVLTLDSSTENTTHISTTSGSDVIQVGSTAGVRVGDHCMMCLAHWDGYWPDFVQISSAQNFTLKESITKTNIGEMAFVTEIISSTSLRISRNAKATYTNPNSDYANRVYCVVCMPATTASLLIGTENSSWATSFLTGTDKRDSKAVPYAGFVNMYQCAESDPIEKFVVKTDNGTGGVVTHNGNIFPISDDADLVSQFGEKIVSGYFEMPVPAAFDATFFQNADRNCVFLTSCGRYVVETYLTNPKANGENFYTCSRMCVHNLFDYSAPYIVHRPELEDIGVSNATRAVSTSLTAGLITKAEADFITNNCYTGETTQDIANDIVTAMSAIKHAIIMTPSAVQSMSHNFTATIADQGTLTNFYSHRPYMIKPTIAAAGTGYAVEDVLYIEHADAVAPAIFTVAEVGSSGEVLVLFTTHCGQYKTDVSSATSATTTSGAGTGCTIDTSVNITNDSDKMRRAVYPAAVVDDSYLNTYAGSIPMGSTFMLNPSINLATEWPRVIADDIAKFGSRTYRSSYEFLALLAAFQKYGGMTCDNTVDTCIPFQMDSNLTPAQKTNFTGDTSSFVYLNCRQLIKHLVYVENRLPFDLSKPNPDMFLNGEPVVNVTVGGTYYEGGVRAFDEIEGDISDRVVVTGTVNESANGQYPLAYDVMDIAGNVATTLNRLVNVNHPPEANAGVAKTIAAGGSVQVGGDDTDQDGTIVDINWSVPDDKGSLDDYDAAKPNYTGHSPDCLEVVTLTKTVTDNVGAKNIDTVEITVYAVVPPVDVGTVRNELSLSAHVFSGTQDKPFLSSTSGALFRNRDAKITIELDGGDTDAADFNQFIFQIFTLSGSDPLINKYIGNGVLVVDGKFEVYISASELNIVGRHYFETLILDETDSTPLSGYITIVNSRIN